MGKHDIRALSLDETKNLFASIGQKPYRAQQLHEWLWKRAAHSFSEMSNLSAETREFLSANYDIRHLKLAEEQHSADGTAKFRFRLFDGYDIESVLIPQPDRITACISSQVGCSLTCTFCATGKMGRKRNLNKDEIFDQVVLLNRQAEAIYGRPVTNLVYMGMGEPLLNYRNVMESVLILTNPEGLQLAPRRITVSTAGIAKMIMRMGDDGMKCRLAVSLHAADDRKRSRIMPVNRENNISDLTAALDYYYQKTKKEVTFEYILFRGFNDTEEDAKNLVKLCRRIPSKVNVIEYNPVEGVTFEKPGEDTMEWFTNLLMKQRVNVRLRRSRGKDIDAACGQLLIRKKP